MIGRSTFSEHAMFLQQLGPCVNCTVSFKQLQVDNVKSKNPDSAQKVLEIVENWPEKK